jgi:HSP20 family protein
MNMMTQQEERPAAPQSVEQERQYVSPKVNIMESKDEYVLEAEMPGVAKDGLEISLEENLLTITGRRQPDSTASLLYRESEQVDYRRAFELDPAIETGKISAHIEQGILTLTLPKAEKVKPRRIAVN